MLRNQFNEIPKGYVQVTGPAVATALAPPTTVNPGNGGANMVIITTETQAIRWRDDGTDPTAAIGYLLPAGAELVYTGDLTKFKYIQAAATAVVNFAFYTSGL